MRERLRRTREQPEGQAAGGHLGKWLRGVSPCARELERRLGPRTPTRSGEPRDYLLHSPLLPEVATG